MKVGCSKFFVNEILPGMAELQKSIKPTAEHLIDFEIPFHNGAALSSVFLSMAGNDLWQFAGAELDITLI